MFQVQLTHPFGRATLKVEGDLTIYTASEAREVLRSTLDGSPPPDLDLSGIEELDTAGAQLLVWLKRQAALAGKPLIYVHHSSAVVEVLDLLGLTAELGDPILIAPTRRD